MAKAKRVRTYKQTAVNAIILILILVLCLYMAIQFTRSSSPQVSTQRTQTVTDLTYAYLEGYVFRDEDVITEDGDTVVCYTARNGEKVGVDQPYALLYRASGLSASDARKKESELQSLSDRIYLIETGLKQNAVNSDLSTVNKQVFAQYYAYLNSIIDGDASAADKAGNALLSSMVEYSTGTGGQSANSVIGELRAAKASALEALGAAYTLTSERGFNLMYSSDGYESIFSSAKLDGLTPDGLKALAQMQPQESAGRVIGRRIYSPKWYIAIPANEATYLSFTEGRTYEVTFSDSDNVTVNMKLERICIDESDENNAYMLLSSYDLAAAASFSRTQSVRIHLGSTSGYRVPKQAVHEGEQYDYVYILVGNAVELRRVSIKGEGNGYYIVSTYEEDVRDDVSRDIPYLNINDLLITSGNDLYDGKLLN